VTAIRVPRAQQLTTHRRSDGRLPVSHVNAALTPPRPQTIGKIERFHRTMADGWTLTTWLHHYNRHRPHTACANQPPFARLTNVPGQYI
jgi:transposase InsO family protein